MAFTKPMPWRWLPQLGRFVAQRFFADQGPHSAAALTYLSLFALVPLLTLIYSALSLVPALQSFAGDIEAWIYARFLPTFGGEVAEYLSEFSRQARNLSVVGGLFLLVTAYLLLVNIEAIFNRLWGCPGRARTVATFIHYWAILTLGPLLLGAAVAARAYLLSLQLFSIEGVVGDATALLLAQLPRLLGWGALTMVYALVPNQRVSWRFAAIGGLFTLGGLELAKLLFGALMSQTIYTAVYGAFAAVPLFLLWIYLVWLIVLLGAELVWALAVFTPSVCAAVQKPAVDQQWPALLAKLYLLHSGWQAGRTAAPRISSQLPPALSPQQLQSARNWLSERGYIAQLQNGDWHLCCPLSTVTMAQLVDPSAAQLEAQSWPAPLAGAQQLLAASYAQLQQQSLAQLFERAEPFSEVSLEGLNGTS